VGTGHAARRCVVADEAHDLRGAGAARSRAPPPSETLTSGRSHASPPPSLRDQSAFSALLDPFQHLDLHVVVKRVAHEEVESPSEKIGAWNAHGHEGGGSRKDGSAWTPSGRRSEHPTWEGSMPIDRRSPRAFTLTGSGGTVDPSGRRQRSLAAILALEGRAGSSQSRP
jgi:hypothetical protein